MKKAVVLEIKENFAAVLTDEGYVRKIRNLNYSVGQEIELDSKEYVSEKTDSRMPVRAFRRWCRAAAAAAAVFVVSGSGLYYASENVFAYSTVTVTTEDASLELTLNRKDEVVAVKALDENSGDMVSEMKISVRKRRPLSDTLDEITEGKEQAEILVSSRSDERKEKIQKEVQEFLPRFPSTRPDETGTEPEQPQNFAHPEERMPEQQPEPQRALESEHAMPEAEGTEQRQGMPGEEGMDRGQEMPGEEGVNQGQEMPGTEGMDRGQEMPGEEGMDRGQEMPGTEGMDRGQEMPGEEGVDRGQEMPGEEGVDQGQGMPREENMGEMQGIPDMGMPPGGEFPHP